MSENNTIRCRCGGDPYHKFMSIYICYTCYWDDIFKKPLSDDARFIALRTKKLDGLPLELKRRITNEIKQYSKQSPGTFISAGGEVVRRCEECNKIIKKGNCLMEDHKTMCFRCALTVQTIALDDGLDDYDEERCIVCANKYVDCVCSKSTPSKLSGVTSPNDLSDFESAYKEQHEIPDDADDNSDLSSYDSSDDSD